MAREFKYHQIQNDLLREIQGGTLHVGDKLPSESQLMERYGAYQASMLDGGSSSVMVYDGREITSPTTLSQNPEGRYLPDAFLVR